MKEIITIPISFVIVIILFLLPSQIKKRYNFEDYSGFFIGLQYLFEIFCCSLLILLFELIPFIHKSYELFIEILLDNQNIPNDPFRFTFETRIYFWAIGILGAIAECYFFTKSISKIEMKKNYDLIWMFISGIISKYIFIYGIPIVLLIFRHYNFIELIYDQYKKDHQYIEIINLTNILNDIGLSLIFMLYKIQFLKNDFCILFFFLSNIVSFFEFVFGLNFSQLSNACIKLIPFIIGSCYHYNYIKKDEPNKDTYEHRPKEKD